MKPELIWAEWAGQELLEDLPHRQVVFTIPKRLRPYFRYERLLLGELAACAWRVLRLWVLAYFEDEAAVPDAVGFIQTAGELLNFHPHVHLLVTDGVFARNGTFERFTFFDAHLIERLFRAEVLRLLMHKGLISQDVVDNLLSWEHSGFSVHGDVKVPDRESAARLGRYMMRCPIVLERLSLDEDTGEVLYRTRPSRADHPEGPVARWDVYELIGRRAKVMKGWGSAALAEDKHRWVEKTPNHLFHLEQILADRSDAKIVLMLRDGRDVACSLRDRGSVWGPWTDDFSGATHKWADSVRAGMAFAGRIHTVRYEGLVEDPEQSLCELMTFLGERFDPQMLQGTKTPRAGEARGDNNSEYRRWQASQPIVSAAGRWRQRMNDAEKRLFKEAAGDLLIEQGYAEDMTW